MARYITVHVKPHKSHSKKGKVIHVKGYSYKKKDLGKPGHQKGPIHIKHQKDLKKYGYDPDKSPLARHRALLKCVKAYGYARTIDKLNAIQVLTKNTEPKYSRIYRSDKNWLREHFKGSLRKR